MKNIFITKILLPILHAVLLFASLLSFLWADWKIVVIGYVLYIIQKWIFKGCVLSFVEFGTNGKKPREHFTPYYLKKFFSFNADDYLVMRYLDYVIAPLVPIIAIIIQVIFHFQPLLFKWN